MRLTAALALTLLGAPTAGAAEDPFPRAASAYLVAVDGRALWERAADVPRAPASLTKIMTALVVLEKEWNPNAPVRVGPLAAAATGSRLGLAAGEELTAGDLLTATLVRSANDACLALAEHAGGGVEPFVAAMNARAESLGLAATRFANPCGFDDPAQRSSARDLWRLAEAALGQPEFARRVALARAEVRTKAGRIIRFETSNALLGRLPGAAGVKTGFTRGAGKCVVVLAERDGRRVVAVLLDAPDRWWAAAAIVEKAFEAARAGP